MNNQVNTVWEGMPVWAKIAFLLGFPTVVAVGSLYFNYQIVVGQLATHGKDLIEHNAKVADHVKEANASHLMHFNLLNDLRYISLRICQHQSHNERERDECIPPPVKIAIP